MSPGRHGVNMPLKTFYDKDATTFSENLYLTQILTQILEYLLWLMASPPRPLQYGNEDKNIPFSVCFHVITYHVFSIHCFSG